MNLLRTASLRLSVPAALAVCVISLGSRPATASDRVNDAIDAGIEYLLGQIQKEPVAHWNEKPREPGSVALETYALLVAGVDVNHPLIRRNFEYLHKHAVQSNFTYTIACYIFALDAAIAQQEQDMLMLESSEVRARFQDDPRIGREFRPYLEKAVATMVRLQNSEGGWRYGPTKPGEFDNSCIQFAVLAIGAGAKRRVKIDPAVWRGVVDHFIKYQQAPPGKEVKARLTLLTPEEKGQSADRVEVVSESPRRRPAPRARRATGGEEEARTKVGVPRTVDPNAEAPVIGTEGIDVRARGWAYQKGDSNWNMTCSGLSSLILAREYTRGLLPASVQVQVNKAVRDGYGWLMEHWSPNATHYGIYSLEKVADIGGVKLFGEHDWYREVSEHIVASQRPDGGWSKDGHDHIDRVGTAFCLLVLNRATLTTLATKDQVARIMMSGRATLQNAPNDRSWVYVPDLDTTMHYPTLLRILRLRPQPKLVHFLKNIVDNYPDEWKGELIPEMAKVRDAIEHRQVRSIIQDYLSSITGFEYREWEDYIKWHRRWERVVLIGQEQKKDRVPDLIKYYQSTQKSVPLKKTVMWALDKCKAREALPLLLADLENQDVRIRTAAYNYFKGYFIDFPPPFDPAAPDATRQEQIQRIQQWYERQLARK